MHRGGSRTKWEYSNKPKIMLPTKLVVNMAQLASNHSGARGMQIMLSRYYQQKLLKMTVKYSTSCIACLLVNGHHKMKKLGMNTKEFQHIFATIIFPLLQPRNILCDSTKIPHKRKQTEHKWSLLSSVVAHLHNSSKLPNHVCSP